MTEPLSKAKQMAQKLAEQVAERGLPEAVRELPFAKEIGRLWRFDFAWPAQKIALEVEGLIVMNINGHRQLMGRHASITGFKEDCVKYAWAAALGWRVLRFEQSQVKDGTAIDMVVRVLAGAAPTKQTACAAKPEKRRGTGVSGDLDFGAPF